MFGGQRFLIWTWDGDPESIDGFHVKYDCYDRNTGQWWVGAGVGAPDGHWSRSIEDFEPHCSKTCEWYVWAYNDADGTESPHSNIVVVDIGPCPRGRSVSLTFETLLPYEYEHRGPIYGEFWANDEVLSFDGADAANCAVMGELECGYYLHGHDVPHMGHVMSVGVAEIFQSIREEQASHPERSLEAPRVHSVMVLVPEGEDLSIGFSIYEYHRDGDDVLLCYETYTLDYGDRFHREENYFPPHYDDAGDPVYASCRVTASMSVWPWEGGE
jgi:hypothetical protein